MMFLAPNGKVFNAAPDPDNPLSRYLRNRGLVGRGESQFGYRDYGSAVMYADGKILVLGGGDPPTNTAEVIDLNQPSPTWRSVAPMSIARRQLNATLLPDGTVLVTGGTSGPGFNNATDPVYPAELWDPATESWRHWRARRCRASTIRRPSCCRTVACSAPAGTAIRRRRPFRRRISSRAPSDDVRGALDHRLRPAVFRCKPRTRRASPR